MAQPYVGEIRMFGGNFAPAGWMFCNGAPLPISENESLFQLIGTTYGGDGETTFNLPDLRGRIPIHRGTGPTGVTYQLGERAGTLEETLTVQQMTAHSHAVIASGDGGTDSNPDGALLGLSPTIKDFREGNDPNTAMAATTLLPAGGSQPHTNVMPYVCVNFIISLFGIFPSPT